jgi:hypothetical protein
LYLYLLNVVGQPLWFLRDREKVSESGLSATAKKHQQQNNRRYFDSRFTHRSGRYFSSIQNVRRGGCG